MKSPFPGMDPYLENRAYWQDVHNSLINAIRDDLVARLAPRYYVGIERRVYLLDAEELNLVGVSDVFITPRERSYEPSQYSLATAGVSAVKIPIEAREFRSAYLEIREVQTRLVVTVIELLSPANKIGGGRKTYLNKRHNIMTSLTNLVEIDLTREGQPMPYEGLTKGDYRILISRAWERPDAWVFSFTVRDKIPSFPVPLQQHEDSVEMDLNKILHDLYTRARYDLQLDYTRPAVPPLSEEDAAWAKTLTAQA